MIGPGAVGCLLAARLHAAGVAVALLDKDRDRAALLCRDGLTLVEADARRPVRVPVTADPAALAPPAFLCFCVKAFDTAGAVARSRSLVGPRTCLVSVQNGLGNVETLAGAAPRSRVLCVSTALGAFMDRPGEVHATGAGPTAVASLDGAGRPSADRLVGLLRGAGLEAELRDDAPAMLWAKLIVNAGVNPVTALAGVPNGGILDDAGLRARAVAAAAEAAAVARAAGVAVDADPAALVEDVCRRTRDNRSSMLQDVCRGRPTEIEFINGVVVREGARLGVPTPVNAELLEAVLRLSTGDRARTIAAEARVTSPA